MTPGAGLQIVDADDQAGGAWAHRWGSLRLSKTHHVHDLPGLAMGAVDPERRASEAVSGYFGRYE
ncbi:MAG: NAD(P)/FAD-dependent oxidoreductase [Pseudonocardiales bacterium]|nr:NAD(P)/FAD-dependent oxidoreductase [Pseudonocardiales bacterium]